MLKSSIRINMVKIFIFSVLLFSRNLKPMGIFPDAEGQLTPQSVVGSGLNLNSSKL